MERRKALKSMGLAFGYTVAAPTLISLAQSCSTKKVLDWTPDFFSKDEGTVIHTLVDMILPKTDTPSALKLMFMSSLINLRRGTARKSIKNL